MSAFTRFLDWINTEVDSASTLTGSEKVPMIQTAATKQSLLSVIADYVVKTAASFTQSGIVASNLASRTVQAKEREILSVTDAKNNDGTAVTGDGSTDNTTGLQAVFDYAISTGRAVFVPAGTYNYTSLDLDDANGLKVYGEADPYNVAVGDASYLRCTAAGTGIGISVKSTFGVSFHNLRLGYNNVGYTGDLVKADHSAAALDTQALSFEHCYFSGEGSADNATSLLHLSKSILTRVEKCRFTLADAAIKTSSIYVNVLTIEDNLFVSLTTYAIRVAGGTNALNISKNTFEPLASGASAALSQDTAQTMIGLVYSGNWHGDVTATGGDWVTVGNGLGMKFTGNFFATAGAGAGDTCIVIAGGSQGVEITANRFEGVNAIDFSTATTFGVFVAGNDFETTNKIVNSGNVSGLCKLGNLNLGNGLSSLTDALVIEGNLSATNLASNAASSLGLYTGVFGMSAVLQVEITHTVGAARNITLTGSAAGNPTIGTSAGSLNVSSALQFSTLGAFAASDKYLIVDASGNVHVSALGPAS